VAWVLDYSADNGKVFTTDEVVSTMARRSFVTFEPLGVIGSIMPWNFPYWQALRFAAPSLMVGNTIVLFVLKGFLHVSFTIFFWIEHVHDLLIVFQGGLTNAMFQKELSFISSKGGVHTSLAKNSLLLSLH
jgi:hypothetical protein